MNNTYWILLCVFVYLVGYVIAYLTMRYDMMKDGVMWTQLDRMFGLILSLFSWGVVLIYIFFYILDFFDDKFDWDKPAKW